MIARRHFAFAASALLLAGCGTVNEVVNGGSDSRVRSERSSTQFRAELSGASEPRGGDPDGAGTALIEIRDAAGTVCTDLETRMISLATAAHIHRGDAGETGPPVISLDVPTNGGSEDCDEVQPGLIAEIRDNPSRFYFNVHTADYPDGAIRGQLGNVGR